MPSDTPSVVNDALRTGLSQALTFHASFDNGPDADFALGDPRVYSLSPAGGQGSGRPSPGLGDPPLSIAQGRGKYGAALEFSQANERDQFATG